MPANKYALPLFLAGLALSTVFAQDSGAQPPAGSQTLAQATEPAQPSTAPRARKAGTSSARGAGVPNPTVPGRQPFTSPGTTSKHPRREPCWQVAGVSKSAMQQRRVVAEQARQEVESVCANSALSVQQKRERIREIHQQERQQMEALITPQQQAAMRACQEQRGGGHPGGGHLGGGHGAGPCGTMPGFPEHENATEPNEASPQN